MARIRVGDIVYCDITTSAARKCLVVAKRRWAYLLKPLYMLHGDSGIFIKRTKGDLWVIKDESLLAPKPQQGEK